MGLENLLDKNIREKKKLNLNVGWGNLKGKWSYYFLCYHAKKGNKYYAKIINVV
jgi:hypothetical protein